MVSTKGKHKLLYNFKQPADPYNEYEGGFIISPRFVPG